VSLRRQGGEVGDKVTQTSKGTLVRDPFQEGTALTLLAILEELKAIREHLNIITGLEE